MTFSAWVIFYLRSRLSRFPGRTASLYLLRAHCPKTERNENNDREKQKKKPPH